MSFFSTVADFLKPTFASAPPPGPELLKALAWVRERVDPTLRAAGNFDKRLAQPLGHAIDYCAGVIGALPGPTAIDHRAFADDPLVHALFATADDVRQMLGRSQAVRDFLASPASWQADHFHALLVARRQEKKQLGMKRAGDVIENDVPQRILFFSDQALIEPHCDLEGLRQRLRQRALESLLQTFQAHLDALRHEREGLSAESAVERSHLTVLRGITDGPAHAVHTRHLAEVDARLREVIETLMPDPLLDALGDFLHAPEPALRLSPFSVSIDRLGVICEAGSDSSVQTLRFPELASRDQRLHLAMLARVDRAEAEEAVAAVRDQQRRFMLI
ncbi:MAG: hypothetical protein LBV49_11900 [Azonexus sp.]|nr:hypothetical protein [Azonexus sp.]